MPSNSFQASKIRKDFGINTNYNCLLIKLRILNLSYNRISKIDNLTNNRDLNELLLASNNIKKIEGIDNLKNLKVLELGFNKIEVKKH